MEEQTQIYDTLIVGSGPAGLTAAIYNLRSDLKTVVIGGNQPGGQLTITTMVGNYPGFPTGIGGMKLMTDMQTQVRNIGGEIKNGLVKTIKRIQDNRLFEVELEDGAKLETRAVIVATGAGAKWLGIKGEMELVGHGISGCATCDGMFFRDKVVAVVGGGDVACEDAEFLSKFAKKVYMFHRRDKLRAQVAQQKKIFNNPKVEIVWNSEIKEIRGTQRLEEIKIVNNKDGTEKWMAVDGLFVAIGRIPATKFLQGLVELKETGQIIIGKNSQYLMMSSVPGIFAAGDCMDDIYRQAIVAAGDGARAGLDAEKWLGNQ